MNMHRTQVVAAAAILAATAAVVPPALATPARDFTRTELSTGLLDEGETRARAGRWEARLQDEGRYHAWASTVLTVLADGHSGWHTHAGFTLVTVVAGEVTWHDGAKPNCPAQTYRAGDSFIEPANNVHLVRNTTGATVVYTAVQVRPAGAPGRIDAAQPTDADCPVLN